MTALVRRSSAVLLPLALALACISTASSHAAPASPRADAPPPPLPPVQVAPARPPAPPHPTLATLIATARHRAGHPSTAAPHGVFLYAVTVDYPAAIETGELFHAFNRSHGKGLSRCLDQLRHLRPVPSGRVRLQLTIAKGGHVATAKLLSSFDPTAGSCALERARGWSFAYLSENGGARLTLEIGFAR